MTRRLKKALSMMLSVALSLVFVLSGLVSAGVTVSFAKLSSTGKNYTKELWLLCGNEYGISNGTVFDINEATDASPVAHDSGTAYIPLSALLKYRNATATVDGDTVTVRIPSGILNTSTTTVTMTVGSTAWSGGEFQLPVVRSGEDIYLSILSVNAVFGTKSMYNKDIGAVAFGTSTNPSTSLSDQIEILGAILFERPSASTIYDDLLNYSGSADTHPRLLATQETFDEFREVLATPNTDKTSYYYKLYTLVKNSESAFNSYFVYDEATGEVRWKSEAVRRGVRQPYYIYDENGNRLVGVKEYTYINEDGETVTLTPGGSELGDGYDFGGRSNVDGYTSKLRSLALLWQVHGDDKYADAFYLLAVELGKWEHWGEGHFLDCADGSVEFAIGLDWIYHAFDDEPEKRDEMAAILYEKGMMKGYYAIVCDTIYRKGTTTAQLETKLDIVNNRQYGTHTSLSGQQETYLHISNKAGTSGWRTINRTNNWQTVCGSGMIISALFLSEYEQYRENAMFVVEQYLVSNERCLLQYAPDGAYIESPGYWGYGTNTLMRTIGALQSSLGTDYGLSKAIGLYESFYYTVGICDGRHYMWNYHDCSGYDASDPGLGSGRVDSAYLYLAARIYNDPTIAAVRDDMLFSEGSPYTLNFIDAIYYSPDLSEGGSIEDLPLDYNFKAIDTATFRSGYAEDSIFTGLHVGPNAVSHGDMDCGNFTLSMGGVKWIADPGSENYNVSGFWNGGENGTRYKLYCKSVEGHSTVMIRNDSSIPRGQRYTTTSTSYAKIDSYFTDENGAYAISDMTYMYGNSCTGGTRGVLLTNSRSTVVLQDEISFSSPSDVTWLLNLQQYFSISSDGRSILARAVGADGEIVDMRITLISDNADLRFREMEAQETVFEETYTAYKNNDPLAKNPVQRVAIEADDVTSFNVAVVFQILGHEDEIVPYTYTPMAEWKTETDEWVKEANKDIDYAGEPVVPQTPLGKFNSANASLAAAFEAKDLVEVGRILRDTSTYLLNYNNKNAAVVEAAGKYLAYMNQYNKLIRDLNKGFRNQIFS